MSAPTTPVCYRHPSRETGVRCVRCERPICTDCMNEASVGFQCPECVAEGRRTQRQRRTAFGGSTAGQAGYATKALIALNVLFMAISTAVGGITALIGSGFGGLMGSPNRFTQWGAVIAYDLLPGYNPPVMGVAHGEYYRLFTAMFIHYGLLHLLVNMYALWILGRTLEQALGPLRFTALYLLSGLGGNVAAYLFSQPGTVLDRGAQTAGASTAIFGLFAALFVLLRRVGRDTSAVLPVIIINIVFTLTVPGISIPGHLGGLVTGAAVAGVLAYAPQAKRAQVQGAGLAAIFAVLVVATLARTLALTG
jgi:membrane associated rhomboid family serine protease